MISNTKNIRHKGDNWIFADFFLFRCRLQLITNTVEKKKYAFMLYVS